MTENERLAKLEKQVDKAVKDIEELCERLAGDNPDRSSRYNTIMEYLLMYGIDSLQLSQALMLSKDAAALSREQGYEIRKADDERFGTVNSYHVDVLDQVFQL